MNRKNIELLEKSITKDTRLLIWLTDTALTLDTEHIDEINIFSNRIITRNILNSPLEDQYSSSLFKCEHFGNCFFIFHIIFSEEKNNKELLSALEVTAPHFKANDQALVLNKSLNTKGVNVVKELKSNYPNIEFNNLYL